MKLILVPTVVGVSALLLTGCVAAPEARPTPAGLTASSSAPSTTPAPVELSSIRMEAGGLTLLGESDELMGTVGFLDDPTETVARLTDMLNAEPVVEASYRFVSSGTPVTVYRWDGLLLQIALDPAQPDERRMSANFVEPYSGTIRLLGPGGVSVGDPMSGLPDPIALGSYEGSPNEPRYLLGDPVTVTRYADPYEEYVQGFDEPGSGTLAELMAPVASYGGPSWRQFG